MKLNVELWSIKFYFSVSYWAFPILRKIGETRARGGTIQGRCSSAYKPSQPQPSTVLMQSSNSVAFKAKDCFLWNISFMSALRLGFLLIYMFFAKRLSILILYRKKIIGTISGSSIAPIISYTFAMIQDIFEFRASRPCSELEKI